MTRHPFVRFLAILLALFLVAPPAVSQSLDASSPAREYIYAGGGLVAVVEHGSSAASGVVLTAKFTGASASTLSYIDLVVESVADPTKKCWVRYKRAADRIVLVDDDNLTIIEPQFSPGSSGTSANSQCSLDGTGSSVTEVANTSLTVNALVTFAGGTMANGNADMWAEAEDSQGIVYVASKRVTISQ